MANIENRLSNLPQDTDRLELNALKDANDMTLNEILDTINDVFSNNPNIHEIQTAEVYLANLKRLSERFESGVKDVVQSDNLTDEYDRYVGTKKRLQMLKSTMRQKVNNEGGIYDPVSGTYQAPSKNKRRVGNPLDAMMKGGEEAERLSSGVIGEESAYFDNARGHGSIQGKFSDSVGFGAEGILSHMVGEDTAISVDVEAGSEYARILATLGHKITESQRVKLTYSHFRRATDFMFASGKENVTIAQNSFGVTYRLQLDKKALKYLELNGYITKADSKELEDKTFYVDTPTLYELYNNKRRIAGGKKQSGSAVLGFEPWKGGELRLTINRESTRFGLKYDENDKNISRFGAGASLMQKINDKTSLEVGVTTNSTETTTEAKLRYSLPDNVSLYIQGQNIRRRGDIGGSDSHENIIGVGVQGGVPDWVPFFGDDAKKIKESARIFAKSQANRKPRPYIPALDADRNPDAPPPLSKNQSKQYNEFLLWVEQPAVKDHTIIAIADQRTDRLVAIDKNILPPSAHPDLMTGDLIVDIVPATGIAGVTKDGAPYANNNNFTLNSSKNQLIINTTTLAVPPVGVTNTYVVTINEAGGGQTLVTIDVQHGSVRISRVDIQRIAGTPDTSPDAISFTDKNNIAPSTVTESDPLTVTGINTATPISIAGGAGQYAISTDGGATYSAWTNAPGTINNGNKVKVRLTSSAIGLQTVSTVLTVGDKSDSFDVTTASQETAPTVAAPTATTTETSVTVTNHITDPDGVQNITYYIYSDAAGTALVSSNTTGVAFAGLPASTNYWVKTTAETRDGNTGVWTLQTSPLLAVTTDAANLAPTITNLPNFGAGVASGSTTNKSVTFGDETAWGAGSTISITADNGASIANIAPDVTSYGAKTFDFIAPVNPAGSGPKTITITYTVTDALGVQTQTTQTVDVAEAADMTLPATPTLTLATGAAYTKLTNVAASITNDTDNIGVTGWYISESSSTPALGSFVAEPSTFDLSAGDGLKTVYVWTRDAAGNISNPGSDTITLDQTVPTLGALPNFGAGVASGSTTAKTIDMTDNNPFVGAAAVSISADNGASITGFDNTSYGIGKPFNFVAPVNPAGSGPLTVTITYTITDAAGNITTQTQTVDVAEAPNNNPVAEDVTQDVGFAPSITYDLAANISDVETPDAGLTIVVDTPPAHTSGPGGSFVWETNTRFKLQADIGYSGPDSFTYHVVDALGGVSTTKTVTINNLNG